MNKKNIVILFVLVIIICLTGCELPSIKKAETVLDGISFKVEYEEYNENGFYPLNIEKENPMKYVTVDNFKTVLSSDSVIYLGYAECNICRNVVDILVNEDIDIEDIYYIDVNKIRNNLDVVNDKIKVINEGTSEYAYLLEYLNDYTDDYVISKDDKVYNTNYKIIYAPALLFIKDGNLVKYYNFKYNELSEDAKFTIDERTEIVTEIKDYLKDIYK